MWPGELLELGLKIDLGYMGLTVVVRGGGLALM